MHFPGLRSGHLDLFATLSRLLRLPVDLDGGPFGSVPAFALSDELAPFHHACGQFHKFCFQHCGHPKRSLSIHERRPHGWPLTWVVIAGTLPGIFIGCYIRVLYLPDARSFKLFVGCVLLYIGVRLLYEMTARSQRGKGEMKALEEKFNANVKVLKQGHQERLASKSRFHPATEASTVYPTGASISGDYSTSRSAGKGKRSAGLPPEAIVKTISWNLRRVEYEFWGQRFSFSTVGMFLLAFVVGIIGGTYGIGGGAIIAPFCVAVFHLPIYTVAGAALLATFITSVAGVFFYSVIPVKAGILCAPDWLLGFLFGAGGFAGMYCGARLQKFVPQKYLKLILGILIAFLAGTYIFQYFTK